MSEQLHSHLSFAFYLILCLGPLHLMAKEVMNMIPIGVVLDLKSPIGSMANSCIWMAYHDFYKQHPHFQTRLDLHTRDSDRDTVTAAYAASGLMNEKKVHAIIGPQTSGQARYVIELGREHNVPIISFSATSPSLCPTRNQIFIRTAQDDSTQVLKAIAAIVKAYGWREITPIYEDTEYGNGLIPYLIDALEAVDTRVPYRSVIDPNSEDPQILEELKKLKHNSTRIFLVHMTAEHGSKLFSVANKIGMMTEGYAWIITEGLSHKLNPIDPEVMDSMQGVLGVRPHMYNSERLKDFKKRWKALSVKENFSPLTFFGLWAYDTVWALAMAVETQITNSTHKKQNVTLLSTMLATKFHGLSGYFSLTRGQLEPSMIEIFNVVGHKERVIGFWSQERGVFQDFQSNIAKEKEKLKQPIWPGDTTVQPPKLRIGVPVRKGFTEFIKLESKSADNTPKFSGFVIDVFLETVNVLPFPLSYEYIPLEIITYDDLLTQISSGKVDAVVGDVTIVYYRANQVDFTLPYSESDVSMVVSMKHDKRRNMWIFLKPLSWSLWLTTGLAFVFTGLVVWLLEHRSNADFMGTPGQQLGMIFWFSFSTLVFAHRERLENNWSRFVLIVWLFAVLIITQSYTASLASFLTVESLQPAFIDINDIKSNNYSVGYQDESFVKDLLINKLGFNESRLKGYSTPEEYHEALSRGTNNGGIAAFFDESPYIRLFLTKYGSSRYAIVGPTYKTDGLAFAFPLKSPLVSYFSRAILNVTEDKDKFEGIKSKYFSSGVISQDQSASITSDSQSLTVYSFAGLFLVTLVASLLSLMFYLFSFLYSQWPTLRTIHSEQTTFWSMVIQTVKHFDRKDSSSLHPPMDRTDSKVHPTTSPDRDGASQTADDIDNHSRTHSHSEEDDVILNEDNPI